MHFASPWDRSLRISTALVVLAAAGAAAFVLVFVRPMLSEAPWPALLAPAAVLVVLAVAFALAPRGFRVAGGHLVVERMLFPVEIDLATLRAVARLPDGALRGALRVAGTSGFCGYYGWFRSPSLGSFRLYATRATGLVCLDTPRGRFVLSPEPPDRFVEAVLARAPRASVPGPGQVLRAAPAGKRRSLVLALVIGLAVGILGVVFGLAYGMAPVGVRIEGDAVRVERRWAGPEDIPIASIRRASPLTAEQRRGWVRTAGTALGPVAYGRFHAPALGSFRLYAWRAGGAVLLETDEGRVVVTVEDPRSFVEELRGRLPSGGG